MGQSPVRGSIGQRKHHAWRRRALRPLREPAARVTGSQSNSSQECAVYHTSIDETAAEAVSRKRRVFGGPMRLATYSFACILLAQAALADQITTKDGDRITGSV